MQQAHISGNPQGSSRPRSYNPQAFSQHINPCGPFTNEMTRLDPSSPVITFEAHRHVSPSRDEDGADGLPNLVGIVAEAGDDSSHIISPAVADDNDILESYLSTAQTEKRRCLARSSPTSNGPLRPVRFNVVPRRPLGVSAKQSIAESKLEIIERYMDPHIDEFLGL